MKNIYKYFIFMLLLIFIGCNKYSSNVESPKDDSVQILNLFINSLSDSIHVLNDSLFIVKSQNNKIEKMEVIKLKDLKGRDLYVRNCKFCHGDTGKGDGIKSRVDTLLCPHDLTTKDIPDQKVYFVILNGLNDMPPKSGKLNEDEIWLLVVYVNNLK
jgi:cytochrome c5